MYSSYKHHQLQVKISKINDLNFGIANLSHYVCLCEIKYIAYPTSGSMVLCINHTFIADRDVITIAFDDDDEMNVKKNIKIISRNIGNWIIIEEVIGLLSWGFGWWWLRLRLIMKSVRHRKRR